MRFRTFIFFFIFLVVMAGCSSAHRASKAVSYSSPQLSLPSDKELEEKREEIMNKVVTDSTKSDGPLIMNAIRDEETGEMVATDVIVASKITARFRHVAERLGRVSLEFDISVPSELLESRWQLRFHPTMKMLQDSVALDPVFITGRRYRDAQLRGYQRYQAFLASIVSDTADLVWLGQLEIFLQRNFPQTYAMRNDTTIISEPLAEDLFGVTQRQALEHYTSRYLMRRNDRRIRNKDKMYSRYVKDPILAEGIRLDTVINSSDGTVIYRYVQEVNSRPGLKKIIISLDGSVYDYGQKLCDMQSPEDLVFYVSSLSGLTDPTVRYMTKVISRNAYDRTLALIDFAQGRSDIDTSLGCNASELRRILRSVDEISSNEEYELDSVIVTASCSPEGNLRKNASLARDRAHSMVRYLERNRTITLDSQNMRERHKIPFLDRSIPENWSLLEKLVTSDQTLSDAEKASIGRILRGPVKDLDAKEVLLSRNPSYRYLREKLYPRLRTVQLEFYTHRAGMIKDTIHTVELDTSYMAGVEALRDLDYKRAVELLRPYRDYNAALALVAMSYNHSALEILAELDQGDARVLYLSAVALSRLEHYKEALDAYQKSVEIDQSMVHRANLDPEIFTLLKLIQ